jgi:hypothetical protein
MSLMLSVKYKPLMLSVIMLNVIMLSVTMQNVVMPSVIILNVAAPSEIQFLHNKPRRAKYRAVKS